MSGFDSARAWDAFEQFIEDNGGEFFDLTAKKIRERGSIVHDPEHPNLLVLDIERHRSLPGSHYEKGQPMAAYETYIQRISFDPLTKRFEEISTTVTDRNVNVAAMAREHLDMTAPRVSLRAGSKTVRVIKIETSPDFRLETSVLSEAVEAVKQEFQSLNYADTLIGLGSSEAEVAEYALRLSNAVTNLAVQKVKDLWDGAEEA